MSGRSITRIHRDGLLVSAWIHSRSLNLETIQLRPFPITVFNKLLLNLPVCLILYTKCLVIYEATFSLDEHSLCNSNVHNRFESTFEEISTRVGHVDDSTGPGRKTRKSYYSRTPLNTSLNVNPYIRLSLACIRCIHTRIFKWESFICYINRNRKAGMFCEMYCQPANNKYSQKCGIQAVDSGPNNCRFSFSSSAWYQLHRWHLKKRPFFSVF